MPSSKEARARQNRQKERVAAARAERQRVQRRRRQVGGTAGVIVLVVVVALGFALGGNNSGGKVAVAPTSTDAPTTTTMPSVKGKPCVGLKDPLPKGSPAFLIAPGPAPTKLVTQDLKIGTGAVVPKNAKVTVNYTGVACSTGKIFDSSYTAQPYDADLSPEGGIIQGWQQGVPGMKVGGVREISIPSSLAYGTPGKRPIGGDEALFFLIAVVKID